MSTLLVRGLSEEGPGDIVGAFVNEADVGPDAIGEIELDDTEATIEVEDDAVSPILDAMDDSGRIGDSDVSVTPMEGDLGAVREYVSEYSRLVDLEREAEMERHEREIRDLSGRERESKDRAILHLEGRDQGEGLGGGGTS